MPPTFTAWPIDVSQEGLGGLCQDSSQLEGDRHEIQANLGGNSQWQASKDC